MIADKSLKISLKSLKSLKIKICQNYFFYPSQQNQRLSTSRFPWNEFATKRIKGNKSVAGSRRQEMSLPSEISLSFMRIMLCSLVHRKTINSKSKINKKGDSIINDQDTRCSAFTFDGNPYFCILHITYVGTKSTCKGCAFRITNPILVQ